MTYCVGVKLEEGLILASDSRTHAGVDNYAKFCKMTVFERAGDPAENYLVMAGHGEGSKREIVYCCQGNENRYSGQHKRSSAEVPGTGLELR